MPLLSRWWIGRYEHHLVGRWNPRTCHPMADGVRSADRQAVASADRRDHRQGEPAAPRWRATGWRRKAFRSEPVVGSVASARKPSADKSAGATNAAPEKRTGRRRRARHAAVFVARTWRQPLPLAARRGRGDDVLRRRCGARSELLRAPPAASAWPGQRVVAIGAILAAMPLSIQHRHAVVFAGRTHDVGVITTVVSEVLVASPERTCPKSNKYFGIAIQRPIWSPRPRGSWSCSVRWQCWWRSAKRAWRLSKTGRRWRRADHGRHHPLVRRIDPGAAR